MLTKVDVVSRLANGKVLTFQNPVVGDYPQYFNGLDRSDGSG